MTSPILARTDCRKPFKLTTDSSRSSLRWVLEQEQEGRLCVICYGGRTLNQAQANYPISDLEALVVMTAIRDQSKWIAILSQYNFEVEYVKGPCQQSSRCCQ